MGQAPHVNAQVINLTNQAYIPTTRSQLGDSGAGTNVRLQLVYSL